MEVDLGPVDAVPDDRCVDVGDGRGVAVRVGDHVLAFQPHCLHRRSPLAGGLVVDGRLQCPLHFWRYLLPDGVHTGGGGRLTAYDVEVVDGHAVVHVPDPPPRTSLRDQLLAHAREWDRDAPRPGPPDPSGGGCLGERATS